MNTDIDLREFLPGAAYPRPDRGRYRNKKVDFWTGMNGIGEGVAVMMRWEKMFGNSLEALRPFLKLTGKAVEHVPCPSDSDCGCMHYVSETRRGETVATCQCTDFNCSTHELDPEDVLSHGVDWRAFGEAVCRALGFAAPASAPYAGFALREIGSYASVAAPVYMSFAGKEALVRDLIKLQGLREGPFLLLTATGGIWIPEVETLARPQGGGHISLSSVLVPDGAGFRVVGPVEAMLAEFARRAASLRQPGGTLQNIHREIAAVRQDFGELRSAKQRLEKMLADGMFAFTRKVDATSFKVLCAILAEGDVSKAGRRLGIAEPMMRYHLRQWKERGGTYNVMLEMVRWRKKVGRRETVALNEAILHEKAETTDYPGLLSDVLDGLLSMTATNWQELAEELAELVRPALG